MSERKTIIIKLNATHLALLPILLILSFIFRKYGLGLLLIAQSVLIILFLAGYWEFFGLRFKRIFLVLCQVLILLFFAESSWSNEVNSSNIVWLSITGIVILYLFNQIVRILITIFISDKEKVEISFPFRNGHYLITDGGNSKISRLMNYHFHSPVHKQKKINLSMLYATDIVKLSKDKTGFLPLENGNYSVFGKALYCPLDGEVVKVVND